MSSLVTSSQIGLALTGSTLPGSIASLACGDDHNYKYDVWFSIGFSIEPCLPHTCRSSMRSYIYIIGCAQAEWLDLDCRRQGDGALRGHERN